MRWAPFAILFLLSQAAAQAPQIQELHVRADAPAHPFPHFWEQTFGSGRAILSLRESYRQDLRRTRQITNLQYVRFHAIFQDEVGLYDEDAQGHPIYNFSYVDQIYDGLLEAGVRPYVELSFMPRKLSSTQAVHAFWYKQYPNPPRDYARWDALIAAFTRHLIERYGEGEVEKWWFEVWNEPNIDFWTGQPKQATYFTLYDHTARAIKQVDSRIRVGGPATAQAAWVDAMIAHCVSENVPLDFVSTHVYANDTAQDVLGSAEKIPRSDMVARAVAKVHDQVKRSARPALPIHWSEYNASYMNETEVTDSAFMGPWLANTIRLCDGLTSMMSYWTFSDVFEEQGVVKTPFYGGYGLIAEGNVSKAAFNAFRMLHRLGDRRLEQNDTNVLATKRSDGSIAAVVWNYAPPGESGPARMLRVVVDGLPGKARYLTEVLDEEHGSALTAWRKMGSPAWPTHEQYIQLRKAATGTVHSTSNMLTLPPHGLALVEATGR